MNFKEIHIGSIIYKRVTEFGIEADRICNFFKCSEDQLTKMYKAETLDSGLILKWSKLLEYDFFRIYTQHLILFAPQGSTSYNHIDQSKISALPTFRKNIYTKEVIDFILELISTGEKTKQQITLEYKIPKTTLYKWLSKYKEY
ncbi:transposase [Chryseobacterium tongliaoense]|uniref:transposase n=1 Tax=Chryseobacterium tongliaoense TaxID=3240933 RepID=UPI00351258EB